MKKTTSVKQFTFPAQLILQLRNFGVAAVYLFGSRAYGVESPISDFDFGVLLRDPRKVHESSTDLYQPLYNVFSEITHPATLDADIIDIVFLDSPRVSLELKLHIIRRGKIIFDDVPLQRAHFETSIMIQSADFAPLREEMRLNILARI